MLHDVPCKHADSSVFVDEHDCGLDALLHETWSCGLKQGGEVARVGRCAMSACDEGAVVGQDLCAPTCDDGAVVSKDLCASNGKRIALVRAHDWFDERNELSVEHQVEPYLKYLRPLLSQVADNTDASWWLLDSGASTSVLAESNLAAFRSVLQNSEELGGYRAANGSSVEMSGTAEIGVQMDMSGPSGDDWCWKKARLNVLVGSHQTQHLVNHIIGRFRIKVQKDLICFMRNLVCIALMLRTLLVVHGSVYNLMLVRVVHIVLI